MTPGARLMIGAGGLREVPAMTATPTPGIITDVGLRLGVLVALLATAAAEGIHMKFDASNWILYDFDWSNQA